MHSFDRLEAFAESLLTAPFARWLKGRVQLHDLAVELARTLADARRANADAPACYHVSLHAHDLEALRADAPALEAALAETVVALARQAGLRVHAPPTVTLHSTPEQAPCTVTITTDSAPSVPPETLALNAAAVRAALTPTGPALGAYLVVHGKELFALTQPLVTLGRHTDNDIVLDDPRVSRHHAQLRLRYGHHVIYDLDSRAGTWLNGTRVTESALAPGDVLRLGACELIYGREEHAAPPAPTVSHADNDSDATRPGHPRPPEAQA